MFYRMSVASLLASIVASGAFAEDSIKDDARVGDAVSRICFASNINNFRFIDTDEKVVLLQKSVNDWFLVELFGPCRYRNLRFSQAVGIDTFGGGGCLTRGDTLVFSDTLFKPNRFDLTQCRVGKMYQWDEDAAEEEASKDGSDM